MKTEQMASFKKLFESQKQNLMYSGKLVNEKFNLKPEELSDEVDLASAELEQNMLMKLRGREAVFLKKIDQALDKIHAGTFGVCECCEEDIELSRLEVRPTADLCINCKEAEEDKESRFAGNVSIVRIA